MNDYLNNKGKFKPGNPGGGRPKGSKNKSSENIRGFFSDFLEKHISELNEAFNELEAREKFKVLLDMAKYVIPVLRSQDNIIYDLSDDLFNEVVEQIKKEYQLD